jgi:hypothetical protein
VIVFRSDKLHGSDMRVMSRAQFFVSKTRGTASMSFQPLQFSGAGAGAGAAAASSPFFYP